MKTAEQGIHKLKDEIAKMKTLVAQTRNSCANEVRKRDRQIDSLKKAVADAGRVRGGGKSRDILTISVTGDFGGGAGEDGSGAPVGATENDEYSLRMETNEFLTELAKGLSEENEGLLALVRRTVDALREMSGLDRVVEEAQGGVRLVNPAQDELVTQAPQKTAEELAAELEAVVVHLKSILTNPSFVPIEEVDVRDEAIIRLRAGLETMEARWKDAVHMIDGWRKRMASSGKTVDMEDLNMGLRLSPVRVGDVDVDVDVEETTSAPPLRLSCVQEEDEEEEEEETPKEPEPERPRSPSPPESLHLVPAPGYEIEDPDDDDSDSDSSIYQDDLELEEFDAEEPNVQILQESVDSPPMPEPPQLSPLKDSYSLGNRGPRNNAAAYRKIEKPGDFTTIVEENTWDLAGEEPAQEGRSVGDGGEQSPPPVPAHTVKPQVDSPPEQQQQSSTASYDSPLFGKSGERPSQTQLSRKLFSRPSSAAANQAETQQEPKQTTARTTTTSRKSAETNKRAASDPGAARQQQDRPSTRQQQAANATSTSTTSSSSTASTTSSRLPRRHPRRQQQQQQQQQQSPLSMATITAKLAASEREADAARVRAKLKAVRRQSSGRLGLVLPAASEPTAPAAQEQEKQNGDDDDVVAAAQQQTRPDAAEEEEEEDMDPVKKDAPPPPPPMKREKKRYAGLDESGDELAGEDEKKMKREGQGEGTGDGKGVGEGGAKRKRDRRRTSKAASRRWSTLSPWELDSLIAGNVEGVSAAGGGEG